MTTLGPISLLAATISMGLVSGVFALYAHTIMPGLRKTDDHTFVAAFQSIDHQIVNPWFMTSAFGGALLFTLAAVLLNLQHGGLPWIVAALGLYLAAVVVTITVNVPLNDAIKAAGNPDHTRNLAAVRDRFHETCWAAWNLVRVVTSTSAFGFLAWALVLYGRTTA
jgi:uncharacterized membrane protein